MKTVTLGKTGITVSKNGFGALPIQRIGREDACALLKKAYSGGITFFDTARFYTDSEEKIGCALGDVRDRIFIATKSMALTPGSCGPTRHIPAAAENRLCGYLPVPQPKLLPQTGRHGSGLYEEMLEAKEKGLIRHIGQHQPQAEGLRWRRPSPDCTKRCSFR
jgi:aryl-alcohol dehydrogenase-like predicted oxidoreductase